MRLPKCASTSFVELMKKTTKSNGRFLFHFNPSGAYDWNKRTIDEVTRLIKGQLKTNHRVLYARHFYYTDFPSVSLNHTYITIVRDTVSRVVSSYLYYHFSSRPHIQSMLDPTHRNESLEKCLELNHEGCTPNLMTKYFCGHQKMCKTGSRRALNQAIFNIQKHFTVIGLMEDLHNTYKLFKTLLPEYFGGLDTREMSVVQKNRNEQSMVVSSDIQRKIEEINKADVMLYDYIQKKFNEQISNCINEKKIHNMSYKTANTTITTDN
jgi:dermatan/chondrotin sulfate uronyl 2-O-sulfotransferase UST